MYARYLKMRNSLIDEPWYTRFFDDAYWKLAGIEYSSERTSREVDYIKAALHMYAPGPRVADIGCGNGRHAVALAQAGFDVTAIDISPSALRQAARRARSASVSVRLIQHDLIACGEWPLQEVDGAILIQAFGWGSDFDQKRLLSRVRRCLAPGGVLLLDISNVAAILRGFLERASVWCGDGRIVLKRRFDLHTSRNIGTLMWEDMAGKRVARDHDVRLYNPHEVSRLLNECGFSVSRIDADFSNQQSVTMDTRYVQFLATSDLSVEYDLAIYSHRAQTEGELDLRTSPDEIDFLHPNPKDLWQKWIRDNGVDALLAKAARYAFDDPYGEHRAADSLLAYHKVRVPSGSVTFGAGISGLLRQLALLATGGLVLMERSSHPDFGLWAAAGGASISLYEAEEIEGGGLLDKIHKCCPAVVVINSPTIHGFLLTEDRLLAIANDAAAIGAVIIVDEAYSNYLGPSGSLVPFILDIPNVIIVRSVSKGYCMGGLRIGYAVASPDISREIRDRISPLGVAELPFLFALNLLRQGDMFNRLRERVGEVKREVMASFDGSGLKVYPGHRALPWILIEDRDNAATALLGRRGIAARRLEGEQEGEAILRMSVPLDDRRISRFRESWGAAR
jgi:histidinol-phosphate/aromatic aminotransferase/cobyric acid decarboxylase-like protein/ubiquinone/menaquinone biosynthesis C-methylase UbiE